MERSDGQAVIVPEELIEAAQSVAGLTDFGAPGALVAFARLVDDLNGAARLSPGGEQVTQRQLTRILRSRLEVVDQLKRRPEVLERPVTAPIVIAGLPRTGTTFLHHLMARDPQFDFMPYWQARRPYRPAGDDDPEVAQRRQEARETLALIVERCPELLQIHPMGPDEPDECIVAMQLSFVSLQFELVYRVPNYSAWLSPAARLDAYREFVALLQLLQRPEPGGRWLLKSPGHSTAGWPLVIAFPDVRVVQIHRDPVKVTASLCSLANTVRSLYSDTVDLAEIGIEWLGRLVAGAELFSGVRASLPAGRICDVAYSDFVADPVGIVRAIYEQFGLDLTAGAEAAMRVLVDESRGSPLRHAYDLADYGLSEKEVTEAFAPYLDRFAAFLT